MTDTRWLHCISHPLTRLSSLRVDELLDEELGTTQPFATVSMPKGSVYPQDGDLLTVKTNDASVPLEIWHGATRVWSSEWR